MHNRMKIGKLQYISSDIELIEQACSAGIKWIQLRIKKADVQFIESEAIKARAICDKYNATLIINDYPEIAMRIKADGVHLGKEDLSIAEARRLLGNDFIIGATSNTLEDVQSAIAAGADYIGLGPFRYTETKERLSPVLGLKGYTDILTQLNKQTNKLVPIIAVGGITELDIDAIITTGMYGIAVSGAISTAKNKKETITNFMDSINKHHKELHHSKHLI